MQMMVAAMGIQIMEIILLVSMVMVTMYQFNQKNWMSFFQDTIRLLFHCGYMETLVVMIIHMESFLIKGTRQMV